MKALLEAVNEINKKVTEDKKEKANSMNLFSEIRTMINETRVGVAKTVNAGLTILYWRVGKRISEEVLRQNRAEYGEKILPALSAKLVNQYGRGWSERNLAYMIRFAEVFPDQQILHALCAKLSWSHFRQIIYIDDPLKREFYAEMCRVERWSTRALHKKIDSMLYERTAISKKPEEVIKSEIAALRDQDIHVELNDGRIISTPMYGIRNYKMLQLIKYQTTNLFAQRQVLNGLIWIVT